MQKLTITVKELAKLMNISLPTAYSLTERAGFPLIRVGRKKLIPLAALQEWLNTQAA